MAKEKSEKKATKPVKEAKPTAEPKARKTPAKAPATPATEFAVLAPEASSVYLAGDFNGWGADEVKMKKDKKGVWKAKVKLTSGAYQYKYIVDGRWIEDPANRMVAEDPFGGRNSVLIVE